MNEKKRHVKRIIHGPEKGRRIHNVKERDRNFGSICTFFVGIIGGATTEGERGRTCTERHCSARLANKARRSLRK